MNEKTKLMRTVQSLCFTVIDTGMYLNAYDSDEAFEYFKSVCELYKNAVEEYEAKYGPLTLCSAAMYDARTWTDCPMPWETEADC